jgi:flagellar hook assembly protein FlgD
MGETIEGTPISGQDCIWIKHKVHNTGAPPVISVGSFTGDASVIHLSLSEATWVSMVVYDVRGKRVKGLVNASLSSGDHTITWTGRDDAGKAVADGVYFCQVRAGSVEQTVKMLMTQ